MMKPYLFLGVILLLHDVSAFSSLPSLFGRQLLAGTTVKPHPTCSTFPLALSSDANDAEPAPKRRRRKRVRKANAASEESETGNEPLVVEERVPDLKPRDDKPVSLEVQDVRSLVSGQPVAAASQAESTPEDATAPATSSFDPVSVTNVPSSPASNVGDDSLERLLADARRMQSVEQAEAGGDVEGFSIPGAVQNALSTLVTVDFFVVCFFLVWFLAGVFSSYVLGSDTVQIAFNNLFQPIVQPALGVLMIGSIASSIFKEGEEGE